MKTGKVLTLNALPYMVLAKYIPYVFTTGIGKDFTSNPFNITIDAGATEGRGNVSVTCDDEIEGLETFNMTLSLTNGSSEVVLGRNISSEGHIIDSSGKFDFILHSLCS